MFAAGLEHAQAGVHLWRLRAVEIKTVVALAAEPARIDQVPKSRRCAEALPIRLRECGHHVQERVEAVEVTKLERTYGEIEAELEGLADVFR